MQEVAFACEKYNHLMKGIVIKPSTHIAAYGHSQICFRKLVVGHQVAWGLAFQFSRAGPSLRSFRDSFLANLNLSFGSAPAAHRVNFYVKTNGFNGPSWPDICDLIPKLQAVWAVETRCINPADLSFEEQFEHIKKASVHVTSHGGISYLLLFARQGSSSVNLVDNNCEALGLNPDHCRPQDVQILPTMPWLTLFYHKRGSGADLIGLITHALREASFNMHIAMPSPAAVPISI